MYVHFTYLDLTAIHPELISISYGELGFVHPTLASTHSRCGCSLGGKTSPSKQHMQEISAPASTVIDA